MDFVKKPLLFDEDIMQTFLVKETIGNDIITYGLLAQESLR